MPPIPVSSSPKVSVPPIVWGLKKDIDLLKKRIEVLEDKLANSGTEREE